MAGLVAFTQAGQMATVLDACLRKLQGLGLTTAYVGDGVNDIPALHVADVGIGVGVQEAVAAAPFRSVTVSATGS